VELSQNLPQEITTILSTNDRVIVFTQDTSLIKRFLLEEPGRWNVKLNPQFWSEEKFSDKRIFRGHVKQGYKVGISTGDDLQFQGSEIGLDVKGSRITFTKNPFFPIETENVFILKDHFSFPVLRRIDHLPPVLAAQKEGTPLIICPDGSYNYYLLHDQLTMQEISHTLETSGDKGRLHLMRVPSYVEGYEKAVVYGSVPLDYLMCYHNLDLIVLVRNESIATVKLELIGALMDCFSEIPDSALSVEYLSIKTSAHPRSVLRALMFMEYSGCAKKVRADNRVVSIHKKGSIPDDLEFHSIPEGEHRVSALIRNLRIPREDLFTLLKKYEKKGLIFSYVPGPSLNLWGLKDEMTEEIYAQTVDTIMREEEFITNVENMGEFFLNNFLEERIQNHCLGNNVNAKIYSEDNSISLSPHSKKLKPSDSSSQSNSDDADSNLK